MKTTRLRLAISFASFVRHEYPLDERLVGATALVSIMFPCRRRRRRFCCCSPNIDKRFLDL